MENSTKKTGLVIMASGLSKRFGSNKLMEPLGDKPVIKWVLDTSEDLFYKRIVVTRNDDVRNLCISLGIECIYHEQPYRSDTVRLGLSAMKDVDYCFFVPGDQPLIKRNTFVELINEIVRQDTYIVRTCYKDTEGSPVGFPKAYFKDLSTLPDGKGGNWIVKNNPSAVKTFPVSDECELWDIDTVSDLAKIKEMI